MDLKYLKQLIQILETSNLSQLYIEEEGIAIELTKNCTGHVAMHTAALHTPAPVTHPAPTKTEPAAAPERDKNIAAITSQMVGTFYASPNPEAAAYVKEGDTVRKGQVVCILEAMKLFNEIISEHAGTVVKCCVENGAPVEYGQELFLIRLE